MRCLFLLYIVLCTAFTVEEISAGKGVLYGDYADTKANDNAHLNEVGKILQADVARQKEHDGSLDARHGLVHVLHTSLHNKQKTVTLPNGQLIIELQPPVEVVLTRRTKGRAIPHHGGKIVQMYPKDTTVKAVGMTTDMLWLRLNENEFVLTRDCRLETKDSYTTAKVTKLEPTLPVHVAEEVTVRKLPSVHGKAVGLLQKGDMVNAMGVTEDMQWIQLGHKQFIPIAFAKLGDPTTPLNPPVSIHVSALSTQVRDIPSYEGKVVTTLHKGDVFQALAVSTDMKWVKIAKNNYVPTLSIKIGLPQPSVVLFPEPIAVKLSEKTAVVKNPNEPNFVVRSLEENDEVMAIGSTEDFKWLKLAHKRYIAMTSARLQSAIAEPIVLNPPVTIKLAIDTPVRHIPDMRGRTMAILRKGDKSEAIGVSADFSWLQLGEHLFIPLSSAFFRKAEPVLNPVIPTMNVTLKTDAVVYKRPGENEKSVRTIPLGHTVQVYATTPDLEWLKINEKEYIKTDTGKLAALPELSPLFPSVKVVLIRDSKIFKSPQSDAMVVRRIKRGETLKASATTSDLKWLVLGLNEYILTDDVAHIANTSPLTPSVKVIIASPVKARNVPAFSGRAVKVLQKGEALEVVQVTNDYKWFKIGKHLYIPASACVLHESEGKNMLIVLKARNAPLPQDPHTLTHPTMRPPAPPSVQELTAKPKRNAPENPNTKYVPDAIKMEPVQTLSHIRVTFDTPVHNRPSFHSKQVKELPKGTLVSAKAIDSGLKWIQIGPEEFIPIANTNAA